MSSVKSSSGFISLKDGTKLWYEQSGSVDKRTLLCIAGVFEPLRMEEWDTLTKDFNIVCFDPRGYGKSLETKRNFSTFVYHQDAKDAAELMANLGHEKYSVYGYSDGGIVGLILAAKHPTLVENLIVGGANCFISQQDLELGESYENSLATDPEAQAEAATTFQMYGGEEKFTAFYAEYKNNILAFAARPDGDICISETKEITCRTLIFQGERDEFVAKCHPDFLHKHIRNSKLHILPNEGHYWPNLHQEERNKLVKDFIIGN